VHVWDRAADGTWTLVVEWAFDQPYGVEVGDVDGDTVADVVFSTAQDFVGSTGSVHCFLNDGGWSFGERSDGLPVLDEYYGDMALGDLDLDGDLDVVAGDWSGRLRVFLFDAAAGWTEELATGLPTYPSKIEGLALGDVNGDCWPDLGVAAYSCGLRVFSQKDVPPCAMHADLGADFTACAGDEVEVSAGASVTCGCGAGGVVYRWSVDGVPIGTFGPDRTFSDTPTSTTTYGVDVACASDPSCADADEVVVSVVAPPMPTIDPPRAAVCIGESVRLTALGSFTTAAWTTNPPGQSGDGATDAWVDAAPAVTTTYIVTVTDAAGCTGTASAVVTAVSSVTPSAIGPSLRVAKQPPDGLLFTWRDPPEPAGELQLVGHPAVAGPPWPAALDAAPVVATAPPGAERAVDADGLHDGEPLVFLKVRGTNPCTSEPGPTS